MIRSKSLVITRLLTRSALCRVACCVADPKCSGGDRRDDTLRLCASAFRDLELRGRYYVNVRNVVVRLGSPPGATLQIPSVLVPTFRLVVDREDGLPSRDRADDFLRVVCTSPYSVSLHVSASLLRRSDGTLFDTRMPILCRSTMLQSWSFVSATWISHTT